MKSGTNVAMARRAEFRLASGDVDGRGAFFGMTEPRQCAAKALHVRRSPEGDPASGNGLVIDL